MFFQSWSCLLHNSNTVPATNVDIVQIKTRSLDFLHRYSSSLVYREVACDNQPTFKLLCLLGTTVIQMSLSLIKGASVIILDKQGYINKIEAIFQDITKFCMISPVEYHNLTDKSDSRIQQHLLDLVKGIGCLNLYMKGLALWVHG